MGDWKGNPEAKIAADPAFDGGGGAGMDSVGLEVGGNNLDFILDTFFKHWTNGSVHHSGGQNGGFWGAAFAFEESGNL